MGYLNMVKYFISVGADIESKDQYNNTPLHIASSNSRLEVVKYLISEEANIESKTTENITP